MEYISNMQLIHIIQCIDHGRSQHLRLARAPRVIIYVNVNVNVNTLNVNVSLCRECELVSREFIDEYLVYICDV